MFDYSFKYNIEKTNFIVTLKPVINNTKELFDEYSEKLNFPKYFGKNWHALEDLINDFFWIEEETIIIIHSNLPKLTDNDFKIYLSILYDSIARWKQCNEKQLIVIFKECYKNKIDTIVKEAKNENKIHY